MTPDRAALDRLATSSPSRDDLRSGGWVPAAKSTDLQRCGYQVVIWVLVRPPFGFLYEYRPHNGELEISEPDERGFVTTRFLHVARDSDLPRVVAATFAIQAQVHRALGLHVTGPGRPWIDPGEGQGTLPFEVGA